MTSSPPRPVAPADWLALPSTTTGPDMMFSATPDARVAVHAHRRPACSCRRSSSRRGRRLDLDRRVEADGDGVAPAGVDHAPARAARRRRRRACSRALSSRSGVAARSTISTAGSVPVVIRPRPLPDVDRRRRGLPDAARRSAPGQDGDRAVLGRHRDPVVGLGDHRRLAGDRVAQHGEAVGRADGEGVEAVEVAQAALERLARGRALAQPPRQVAGGDLGVVVGLEVDALAAQLAAAGGCGSTATRCGRGRGRGRSRTGASAGSSRGSRSPCACGRARGCPGCRRGRSARRSRTAAPSPCRSRCARPRS